MAMLYSVFRYCKAIDYVLIDTYSTINFWYALATSQLCRLLRLKYIPILHGGNLPDRLKKNPIVSRMIFDHSYCNVSPSLYLMEQFREHGFFNLEYIPNSIETENYPFQVREKAAPNLLWVRSFATIYNPIMALEVFYKLKQIYPNATLCMVGPEKDGSLAKAQQKATALNLDVHFTGKLSKSDWISLSSNYSIFINTTHFDNMPISILEVMSLGLAVVSTAVGGIPFLLEHKKEALLIPDNDVDKMVEGIIELIENPVFFVEITSKARTKAAQFEWQSVKPKWITILK